MQTFSSIFLKYYLLYTLGENFIGASKMRNNYGSIKLCFFQYCDTFSVFAICQDRATTIAVAIVDRAITIWKAI